MEDSGGWNVFNDGVRNAAGKKRDPYQTTISQTIISLYHICPISVKPSYQGLGIIHPKPWFVNRDRNLFWMKIAKYPGKIPISS